MTTSAYILCVGTEIRDRFAPYDHALEGLLGLATLWVAYAHVWGFERQLDPAYHPSITLHLYSDAAHGGILIFFALSGYVIGLTNQAPFSRANALRYLLRRFIRLYPIYAISIALAVLVSPHDTWKTVIGNLLFLQVPVAALLSGNGVLWTLNYEVVYYLAFLAIWYFRPKIAPLVCGTFIVACLGWFIPSFPQSLGGYAAGSLFWLFGLWLAWKRPPAESPSKAPLFAYLLLFIVNERLKLVEGFLNSLGFHNPGHSVVNLTALSFFPICALVFAAVANRPFSSWRPLQVIAFRFLLAYSRYLLAVGDLFENIVWIICSPYILLAFALVRWRIQPKLLNVFAFLGSLFVWNLRPVYAYDASGSQLLPLEWFYLEFYFKPLGLGCSGNRSFLVVRIKVTACPKTLVSAIYPRSHLRNIDRRNSQRQSESRISIFMEAL